MSNQNNPSPNKPQISACTEQITTLNKNNSIFGKYNYYQATIDSEINDTFLYKTGFAFNICKNEALLSRITNGAFHKLALQTDNPLTDYLCEDMPVDTNLSSNLNRRFALNLLAGTLSVGYAYKAWRVVNHINHTGMKHSDLFPDSGQSQNKFNESSKTDVFGIRSELAPMDLNSRNRTSTDEPAIRSARLETLNNLPSQPTSRSLDNNVVDITTARSTSRELFTPALGSNAHVTNINIDGLSPTLDKLIAAYVTPKINTEGLPGQTLVDQSKLINNLPESTRNNPAQLVVYLGRELAQKEILSNPEHVRLTQMAYSQATTLLHEGNIPEAHKVFMTEQIRQENVIRQFEQQIIKEVQASTKKEHGLDHVESALMANNKTVDAITVGNKAITNHTAVKAEQGLVNSQSREKKFSEFVAASQPVKTELSAQPKIDSPLQSKIVASTTKLDNSDQAKSDSISKPESKPKNIYQRNEGRSTNIVYYNQPQPDHMAPNDRPIDSLPKANNKAQVEGLKVVDSGGRIADYSGILNPITKRESTEIIPTNSLTSIDSIQLKAGRIERMLSSVKEGTSSLPVIETKVAKNERIEGQITPIHDLNNLENLESRNSKKNLQEVAMIDDAIRSQSLERNLDSDKPSFKGDASFIG